MADRVDLMSLLDNIRNFFKQNDRLPSIGEVADICNYSSRNSAVYVVNRLIEQGFLKKDMKGKLISTPEFHQRVRLLGSVSAGFPSPEEEVLRKTVSLEEFLVNKVTTTYMLMVKGDSMINAGICPGDYVLVERGRDPASGNIVVANVDNEWTMKYFIKKNGLVCLEAANPEYEDIYPSDSLYIAGVVVSSCRKYI
ncbi:MAG: LexA family transcriptional regulator [bacterium]|nr:LexA family transcriptional regulator [bacterium]